MKKELDKLRQKDMYEECDKSTLTPEQLRKVVKTRWVVGDRADPTTTATTGEVHASELRARFVAKGYSPCRRPHVGMLRSYTVVYQPEDTTTA